MNTNEKDQQYNQPTGACQSQGGIRRIQIRRNSNTTQPTHRILPIARPTLGVEASGTGAAVGAAGLLFSPRGRGRMIRVIGHFSQTCRLTAENDEGPMA